MKTHLKLKTVSALALMALCMVSTGTAQATEPAPPAQDEPVVSDTVVIRGRSPAETRRYVEEVIAPPRGTDQFARWDDRLCVGVSGIPGTQAQYIADRIANRAMQVGLRPGKPGCKSDVSVIVTTEPEKLIEAMRETYEPMFGINNESRTASLGQSAFEKFKTTDRPVRWWHVAETRGADGSRIEGEARNGVADGVTGAPTVRAEGSRLRGAIRQDLSRAVVVIDANQVTGLSLDTLADFVAFVTLAQADPNGDTKGVDTILNLFADHTEEKPETWSSWDADFLTALYAVPRNTVSLQQTKSLIAQRMERE
jgi:hypothetical protein